MTDREFTNDFKYIMQDLYKLYFGAKCSYKEILESDETYVRFKAVCRQCLITEVDQDTTLESHLYYLTAQDPGSEKGCLAESRGCLRRKSGRSRILWR